MPAKKQRVVVAMSGGVDSSVAAALLLQQGFEVIGVTLRLRACEEVQYSRSCCGVDSVGQAEAVAGRLGIAHYVLDCRREFEELVLRSSWAEYISGRTPNPCVLCNELVKFGLLLNRAIALGAEKLATGHYVRLGFDHDGRPFLLRGMASNKDQSYFLFTLDKRQLSASLFPLGEMTKGEVRAAAAKLKLPNAERPDSQGACLLAEGAGFAESMRLRYGGSPPAGEIVDADGKVLGHHGGIHNFTVGQRHGLGVALGKPAYVIAIHAQTGQVVLSTDKSLVEAKGLEATGVRWAIPCDADVEIRCKAQVRYRMPAQDAMVALAAVDKVKVRFDSPAFAVAPGQAVVFYDGDRVIGGGWIKRSF